MPLRLRLGQVGRAAGRVGHQAPHGALLARRDAGARAPSPAAPLPLSPSRSFSAPLSQVSSLVEKPTVDYARQNLVTPGLSSGTYLTAFGLYILTDSTGMHPVHVCTCASLMCMACARGHADRRVAARGEHAPHACVCTCASLVCMARAWHVWVRAHPLVVLRDCLDYALIIS